MFDPIVVIRTYIQRACNAKPGTGKHVNNNNQLDEELAYTHFWYTENKQEKKLGIQSWIVIGLLFNYYSQRGASFQIKQARVYRNTKKKKKKKTFQKRFWYC